ncbi:MAG TPA: cytochrome c3 family protein [Bryobacteraceae bacterium]|nr:cytochrome c3 family protein [Bryobacteraceae bacterium]
MIQGRALYRAGLLCCIAVQPLLFAATDDSAVVCAKCHPKETAAFLKSAMGNSLATPAALAGGHVTGRGVELNITERDGRMIHGLTENGMTAEYPVAYQIGAGKVGYTYIVRIGDYLFESPVSWYRQHGWDESPGYRQLSSIDFDRLIDSSCLFCHSDNAVYSGTDRRRFSGGTLKAIGCDRCHGPVEEHLQQPSAKNIVNPAKLTPRARNSVCEQCHLEGETRQLNAGKTWQDYHPGEELEKTAATYVLTQNHQEVRAVAQVEQLAMSQCVRAGGGKLWCATCHDPHKVSTDRGREIREVCQGCHATLSKPTHAAVTECVSCHMPRLTPEDIPHMASTDHRILRRPAPLPTPSSGEPELTAWQDPPAASRVRDLALAELVVGGTHGIAPLRNSGVKRIEALPDAEKRNDPAVLSALVSIALQRRVPEKAREFARMAAEKQPDSGFASLSLAIALENGDDDAGAERQLLHTIDLDPSIQAAWTDLALMYQRKGREADRAALIDRYLKWNPQNIWFRQLKRMLSQAH